MVLHCAKRSQSVNSKNFHFNSVVLENLQIRFRRSDSTTVRD